MTDHAHHLQELDAFFSNSKTCRDSFRLLIHFAVRLAALGHTGEVLAIVQRSPDATLFEPLIDGLRLHLGLPTQSVGHASKLALQIAGKIHDEINAHLDTRSVA